MDLFTRRRPHRRRRRACGFAWETCAERASFRLRFFISCICLFRAYWYGHVTCFPICVPVKPLKKSVTCDKSVVQRRHFCPNSLDALQ